MTPKRKIEKAIKKHLPKGQIPLTTRARQFIEQEFPLNDGTFQEVKKVWTMAAKAVLAMEDNREFLYKLIYHNDSIKTSCQKGCSHCCHINVDALPFEAERLWALYDRSKDDVVKEQAQHSEENYGVLPREKAACVFLKDNACSIYDERPFVCRMQLVATPAEFCDTYKYPGGKAGYVYSMKNLILESVLFYAYDFKSIPKWFDERIQNESKATQGDTGAN